MAINIKKVKNIVEMAKKLRKYRTPERGFFIA